MVFVDSKLNFGKIVSLVPLIRVHSVFYFRLNFGKVVPLGLPILRTSLNPPSFRKSEANFWD